MEDELSPRGRIFAAVLPPPEIVLALDDHLSEITIPGRPVPPPNWHITLRFVGHMETVDYERWVHELDAVSGRGAFSVSLQGLGAFPRPARATVLWVGAAGTDLEQLAAAVEEAAIGAGLDPEERPFRPHLTISRIRPPEDVRPILDAVETEFRFQVEQFHLMAAAGSRYRIYETFPV